MAPQKALCSSSGGKDSMLALWHARTQNLHPATLLTMFDESGERNLVVPSSESPDQLSVVMILCFLRRQKISHAGDGVLQGIASHD